MLQTVFCGFFFTEYLVFLFVLAMVYQEIQEMLEHTRRRNYFLKWWNCISTAMLFFFLLSGGLWLLGFAITGRWSATFTMITNFRERTVHKMLLLGNSCFSIAAILSVCHLGDLCQVNSVFGPLQLSVYRMFKDILKFLTIFLGLFFAFTLGVRNLYSYSRSLHLETIQKTNGTDNAVINHRLVT